MIGCAGPMDVIPNLVRVLWNKPRTAEMDRGTPSPARQSFEPNDATTSREKRSARQRHQTEQGATDVETTKETRVEAPPADVVRD